MRKYVRQLKSVQENCSHKDIYWYCASSRRKFLPDELKFIANENIDSKWVPFNCRW